MTEAALVSVVIPVFNGERHLGVAIESVLVQDYRPIQLIVVDDGSTDGSAEVARSFAGVEYHFQSHGGLASALNTGICLTQGMFVALLDADDVWTHGKLSRQIAAFTSDPSLSIVFGMVEQFRDDGPHGAPRSTGMFSGYCKSAMLITRSALLSVGQFDTRWTIGDFLDWYARAAERGLKTCRLPDVVLRRRIHDANMGLRHRDRRAEYARILKQALDRRRQADRADPC